MEKTIKELNARQRELQSVMADAAENAEKANEFTAAEREFKANQREIEMLQAEAYEREHAPKAPAKSKPEIFRETLKKARQGEVREITLAGAVTNSGAIALTIHDLIPNLEEGTGLPKAATVVSGVDGNVVVPTSKNDVELDEATEVDGSLSDQTIDFDKINCTPHRVTVSCDISNAAIDNQGLDIMSIVQGKFSKAWRKYLAMKYYSQANWSGNKGFFSNLTPSTTTISLSGGAAYSTILQAVAAFTDKGFDPSSLFLVIDAVTEANLKATPKASGQGGFIIENGQLAGYDYVVSHYINTTLDSSTGKIVATSDRYLGIAYAEYMLIQTHGETRMTIDSTSKTVAKKNCTNITLNAEVSFTNVGNKLYDADGNAAPAAALYKIS